MKTRNPHAISAKKRKASKIKSRKDKRKNGKNKLREMLMERDDSDLPAYQKSIVHHILYPCVDASAFLWWSLIILPPVFLVINHLLQ